MANFSLKKMIFFTVFTITSIAVNYYCSLLAGLIAFPLYLDSIMTIAVTALCGLIPAFVCAVSSNILLYFFSNTGILFTFCHISTVIISYLVFRKERNATRENTQNFLYSIDSFMWVGFISAITNSILGDTISNFLYVANTSIPQVDNAVQGIYIITKNLSFAAYFGGTITNLIDKIFSALVCFCVYRIVSKIKKNHKNEVKKEPADIMTEKSTHLA